MKPTLLTAALLLAVSVALLAGWERGRRRGFVRSALSLASAALAALLSVWPSILLGRLAAERLGAAVRGAAFLRKTLAAYPHAGEVATAAAGALASSILFAALFPVLWALTASTVSLACRRRLARAPDDSGYEGAEAPWPRRHSAALGGAAGALCALTVTVILLSPFLGAAHVANVVLDGVEASGLEWEDLRLESAQIDQARRYTRDPVGRALYACGGGVVFDSVARSRFGKGPWLSAARETESVMGVLRDAYRLGDLLRGEGPPDPQRLRDLRRFGPRVGASETVRRLAADALNGAAGAWTRGRTYLRIPKPEFGPALDPMMRKVLLICASSNPDQVSPDLTTLLNVYAIAAEAGLLSGSADQDLLASLGEGGAIDEIYRELRANPRTAFLTADLAGAVVRAMAESVQTSGFRAGDYDRLVGDLVGSLDELYSGWNVTPEQRADSLTADLLESAERYGVTVPEHVVRIAASELVAEVERRRILQPLVPVTDHIRNLLQSFRIRLPAGMGG